GLWHPRMAHINPKLALNAQPDLKEWPRKCFCESRTRGKMHKHSHSGKRPAINEQPWEPGEYITCDLLGPLLRSAGGAKYVGFYIDLKSRFVYSKMLREKTDHYQTFREVKDAKARSGKCLRFFKSD